MLLSLFLAGVLTIILPCILPLLPIVVGASISGTSKWRPLLVALGMIVSFVTFTFAVFLVLDSFPEIAEVVRIGTYAVVALFGIGFVFHQRVIRDVLALITGIFFLSWGWLAVAEAAIILVLFMELGAWLAPKLQQLGANVQGAAKSEFGQENPITAFVVGLTLGLVWVPCAGPALAYALTLVREQPGFQAFVSLLAYALGAALPLLIVGYGGQWAIKSVRALTRFTGIVKTVAGVILILTAIGLRYDLLLKAQAWLTINTGYGDFANTLEQKLFGESEEDKTNNQSPITNNQMVNLPIISRAPEFAGLGPWHNSEPFTRESLKGKVVLVDFWTYSCINCIRTLPYIQGYWEKYGSAGLTTGKDTGKFVLLGVHTPEFAFEKLERNVSMAIKEHGLTYPVAQDNEYATWSAFANRYWPAKYLIDADGYIRYMHFGEGGYEETDKAIASLLSEIGASASSVRAGIPPRDMGIPARENPGNRPMSPETYIGERNWPSLGNAQGDPSVSPVAYRPPSSLSLNKYYLTGIWQLDQTGEFQVLRSDTGEIRMKFQGAEINLVLGMEQGSEPAKAEVLIDGKHVKDFLIGDHDLYALANVDYGEHEMTLKLTGKGVEAYAFTFGS